ncbi:MAG: hypothetical protein JJU13_10685 [Balneolaceae bacterium]|nr:hypothetical protein [Balneolaceae bacterium]
MGLHSVIPDGIYVISLLSLAAPNLAQKACSSSFNVVGNVVERGNTISEVTGSIIPSLRGEKRKRNGEAG